MLHQGWKAVRVFVLSETERHTAFLPAYISVWFIETDWVWKGDFFKNSWLAIKCGRFQAWGGLPKWFFLYITCKTYLNHMLPLNWYTCKMLRYQYLTGWECPVPHWHIYMFTGTFCLAPAKSKSDSKLDPKLKTLLCHKTRFSSLDSGLQPTGRFVPAALSSWHLVQHIAARLE